MRCMSLLINQVEQCSWEYPLRSFLEQRQWVFMILSVLEMRYWSFILSNQRKHTDLSHFCFQNTFYKLDVSGYHGNGGDSLINNSHMHRISNGMAFTTYDQDHDNQSSVNCAASNHRGGGWWWNSCGEANPNGFNDGYAKKTSRSMGWKWINDASAWECLKTISMALLLTITFTSKPLINGHSSCIIVFLSTAGVI